MVTARKEDSTCYEHTRKSSRGKFPSMFSEHRWEKNGPHGGSSRVNLFPFMFTEHKWVQS